MADGILTSVVRAWDARGELDSDVLALREETQLSETSGGDGVGVPGEPEAPITSGDGGGGNRTRARMTKKKKRIVVAPAMNTAMWRHPVSLFFFFSFSCSFYVSLSLSRPISNTHHQRTISSTNKQPEPPPPPKHTQSTSSILHYLLN